MKSNSGQSFRCLILIIWSNIYNNLDVFISGRGIQARWKSVRDSYGKDCKKNFNKTISGSGTVKSSRYVFADQLSFLRKVMVNRGTTSSLSSAQETEQVNTVTPQDLAAAYSAARSKPTVPTKERGFHSRRE